MAWINGLEWSGISNIFVTLPAIIILLLMDTPRSPHLLVGSFPEKRHFLAPATSISVESKYVSSIFFLIQCPVLEYSELEPGPKPSPPVTKGSFRKIYITTAEPYQTLLRFEYLITAAFQSLHLNATVNILSIYLMILLLQISLVLRSNKLYHVLCSCGGRQERRLTDSRTIWI